MLAAALRGVHDVGSRGAALADAGGGQRCPHQGSATTICTSEKPLSAGAPDYQCCYRSDAGKDCGMAFTL